jgi:hypothetical protein
MLETIFGGIVGGLTRLAPEVLGFLDKKEERKHELKMQEYNIRITELQNAGKIAITDREIEGKQFEAAMNAMKAGIEAQGKPSGVKWVDGWAAAVRPGVTTWVFILYAIYKFATISLALNASVPLDKAVVAMWGPEDSAMLSAILMFWFVGRVWERTIPRVVP